MNVINLKKFHPIPLMGKFFKKKAMCLLDFKVVYKTAPQGSFKLTLSAHFTSSVVRRATKPGHLKTK